MKSVAYNMDCVEGMRLLPDGCIDMTITSPPYDDLRTYNGFVFDYKATLDQLYRVTKDGGVVCWIVADQTINGSETGTSFRQALYAKEIGFNLHDTMIWEKDGFSAVGALVSRYAPVFEFSKGSPKTFNPIKDRRSIWAGRPKTGTIRNDDGSFRDMSSRGKIQAEMGIRYNVWQINADHTRETDHPAVFPKRLVRDLMVSWSNEGDTILDPFLGSGTTRLVAYDNGRDFIGYEISEQYFKAEEERFSVHTSQMSLFGGLDDGLS